jgi:hypothetical protein
LVLLFSLFVFGNEFLCLPALLVFLDEELFGNLELILELCDLFVEVLNILCDFSVFVGENINLLAEGSVLFQQVIKSDRVGVNLIIHLFEIVCCDLQVFKL